MTPKKFADKIYKIRVDCSRDLERMHSEMDDLMCEVLTKLGYHEGVDLFRSTPKWYA